MTCMKKPAILHLVKLMPAQLIEVCSNVLSASQKVCLGSFQFTCIVGKLDVPTTWQFAAFSPLWYHGLALLFNVVAM